MFEVYEDCINELEKHAHFRFIRDIEKKDGKFIYIKGEKLLNLSSNNYLNFADNKELTDKFYAQVGYKYSLGSASARLLTGTLPVYKELENFGINYGIIEQGDYDSNQYKELINAFVNFNKQKIDELVGHNRGFLYRETIYKVK